MAKILQDIVKVKTVKSPPARDNFPYKKQEQQEKHKKREKTKSYRALWFLALISILFLFFAISFLFSNAQITVNPKMKDFTLNKTITATKNMNTTNGLTYDLVILSGEEKKEVKGGEEKDYLEYAKGSVLIYNAFSSASQSLKEDTRLEGSNGKIYKTKTKVVIPGMLKNGIPGKIKVDIYASEAGSDFNSAPLDFKIFGFKGTSKYSKFYARSVGDITGGLKGKSRQVSDAEKEKIMKELKDALFAKLFQKAKNQIPKDFILLKEATFLNINEENINPATTPDSFILNIKGTFNGILFNKEKLTKEIISEVLTENDNTDAFVSNIEDLSISSLDQNLISLSEMKDITFNLSGTTKIVWKINPGELAIDLLGRNKKEFNQILLQYPNIDSANLIIKPVWKNSFPDKSERIKVIVNYPK